VLHFDYAIHLLFGLVDTDGYVVECMLVNFPVWLPFLDLNLTWSV
jgi:hypothetical protein